MGGGCLLQKQNVQGRRRNKGGEEEGLIVRSQIKYYCWNDWQNYSISKSISHSVSKNIMSPYDLFFFNPTIILFVIHSIYTEGFFLLAYIRMYFTVELISLVMNSVKVTRHRTIWLFLFLIFPLQFYQYIPMENFHMCLLMNTRMKNYIGKVHCNISTEKFH
jgi:hypothetical protein